MNASPLEDMSNGELLRALNKLVASSCDVDADLLAHLAEVDARNLYLVEGCSSMFRYCTEVLHFSEATAFHRFMSPVRRGGFRSFWSTSDEGGSTLPG